MAATNACTITCPACEASVDIPYELVTGNRDDDTVVINLVPNMDLVEAHVRAHETASA